MMANDVTKNDVKIKDVKTNTVHIIVYAICKNEEKNIQRWLDSCKEADMIYVLDTGSTDNTVEILKSNNIKHNIENSFIVGDGIFDFSAARNTCLNNAREEAYKAFGDTPKIYVSIDLDEFPIEGSFQKLKSIYKPEYDAYRIEGQTIVDGVTCFNDTDHKIISDNPTWRWYRAIHETTRMDNKPNVCETITFSYIHEQDLSKERNYFKYTKYAYEQNPYDALNCVYYGWECFNAGDIEKFKTLNEEYIAIVQNDEDCELYQNAEHLICGYFNLINYYLNFANNATMALVYSTKIGQLINSARHAPIRRHFIQRYYILMSMHQYKAAEKCLLDAQKVLERPFCFVDDDDCYKSEYIDTLLKDVRECLAKQQNSENKICVYAICKNELQFVEAWLDSMSEADYIVVLDTGSTDGTYEALKNDHRVYACEQKVISPWRFDVARNEGMLLIPDDANILLSTDLDELLEPGWAQIIKDNWNSDTCRGVYKYAWSHKDDGQPARIFNYDKLHDRNWYWTAPVHELLRSDLYDDEYRWSHQIDLFDKGVYLHHYPDQTKSRGTYLPLLELRAKETPEDYYGLYYLSHEYSYREQYENSNKVLNYILDNYSNKFDDTERAAAYLFMGDNYRSLNKIDDAIYYYSKAIDVDPTYREPYLSIAEIYNEKHYFKLAIAYVEEALIRTYRHYTWVERDHSWNEQINDILSVAYSWLGDMKNAMYHISMALEKDPTNERLQANFALISSNYNKL